MSLKDGAFFATAHTFCASRDGPRSSDFYQFIGYFCAVYEYAEKEGLSKCY